MVSADTAGARELAEANVAGHGAIASLRQKFTGLMCCTKTSKQPAKHHTLPYHVSQPR